MRFGMKKIILLLLFIISGNTIFGSTTIIAHRGASSVAPENTLAAFSKAIEFGADFIECDVQATKDDSLVILHDATLDRTTTIKGAVNLFNYNLVSAVDAGSWFSPEFANERIPTLKQVLQLAKDAPYQVGVVIEIKASNATIVGKVVDLVQKFNFKNRVIVSSFDFNQISAVKTLDPTIPVQLFVGDVNQTNLNQVAGINGEWIGSGGTVNQSTIESAHAKNILLNKWTVNGTVEMANYIAIGVDGITTNFPQTAIALMDNTPPSNVVLNDAYIKGTKIKLSWNKAVDPESGIVGYEIYRDETPNAETLLATVGDTTMYIDETLIEAKKFYYRVKAKNMAGLLSSEYSNEIIAETEFDKQAPKIRSISSYAVSNIIIEFNEIVDSASAVDTGNYSINNDVTISEARFALSKKAVILTVSSLSDNTSYLVTVKGVKDLALIPNVISEIQVEFIHNNLLQGTVGFWNFDEAAGEISNDLSGNLNNGTLFGSIQWDEGFTGNGLKFDGIDDYINIPASTSLDLNSSAVSISLWVKLGLLPAELPGSFGPLYDSDTDNYVLYEDKGNNELRFKVSTSAGAERPGIPAADLVTQEWLNIIGVYDGATAKIYLNGILKDSHNLTGTVKSGQVANIGTSMGSFFDGSIDDIHVLNRALTENEIEFLYNGYKQMLVDTEVPAVESVSAFGMDNKVVVNFSEPVDELSAGKNESYSIDNGITVNSVQLVKGEKAVLLNTTALTPGTLYTLTVKNIYDQAEEPNVLSVSENQFVYKTLPKSLVSFWSMDEGSDTLVTDEASENNITLANGVEWVAGYSGNALNFDAVDDIAYVPNSPSLDIDTAGVTLSVWVKLNYLPTEMPFNVGPIYDSQTDNYVLYEDKGNKELRFKVTTTNGAERPGIPVGDLKINEWINVTGVYDGSSARIYLNGELKDVHANLSGNVKPGQNATLGKDGSWLFSGGIDNIQLYRRGLSEQEVKYLYSGISVPMLSVLSIDETKVTLKWDYSVDPLIGLSGFNIYRDTTASPSILIANVKNVNEYTDETKTELTGFHYRVKAVDMDGNEIDYFSNEVYAETKNDLTSPEVLSVRTTGEQGKILVDFSESINESEALAVSNYVLNKEAKIESAQMVVGNSAVILTASGLKENEMYTLAVSNIKDIAITPNTIQAGTSIEFTNQSALPGLIAYWPLDEAQDTVAYDVSGNSNNAGIFFNPMWVEGKYGNALNFDGIDDYVEIPASSSLNIDTDGVTVSLFVKLDYLPKEMPTGVGPIYDSGLDRYVIYEDKGNKELRFKVTTTNSAERPGIPEDKLVTKEWLHIAGVYNGSEAMIYLNGELMDTHPNITGNVKPDQVARLGQDGNNYFKGDIDNVQVYNRGLSAQEIYALYTGDLSITGTEESNNIPANYSLSQNYPNPFNPSTVINYSISESNNVKLIVYDLLGRNIIELKNEFQNAGRYNVTWNGTNRNMNPVASGIYFYRLTSGKFVETKKMMLVR